MARVCWDFALLLVVFAFVIKADVLKMFDESVPVLKPVNRNNTGNGDIPTFVISGMKKNKSLQTYGKVHLLNVKPVPISQLLGAAMSNVHPQYQLLGMGTRGGISAMRGHFGHPMRAQFGRSMQGQFGRHPMRAQFGGLGLASHRHGLRALREPSQIITEFELDEKDAEEWLDKIKNMG